MPGESSGLQRGSEPTITAMRDLMLEAEQRTCERWLAGALNPYTGRSASNHKRQREVYSFNPRKAVRRRKTKLI